MRVHPDSKKNGESDMADAGAVYSHPGQLSSHLIIKAARGIVKCGVSGGGVGGGAAVTGAASSSGTVSIHRRVAVGTECIISIKSLLGRGSSLRICAVFIG